MLSTFIVRCDSLHKEFFLDFIHNLYQMLVGATIVTADPQYSHYRNKTHSICVSENCILLIKAFIIIIPVDDDMYV